MKTTPVVTVVIMNTRGEILFLRRSHKVGSYRGKWACVSGHIEKNDAEDIERAITEFIEETSLGVEDITEIRKGEIITVEDHASGRKWEVHPFLFRIRDGSEKKIKIDWEHTEYVWSKSIPEDTVPELKRTVENAINGKIIPINHIQ